MAKRRKSLLPRALCCGFLLAILGGMFRFSAESAALPEEVIRLHVVANSDSASDQALKLKVRDAVLAEAEAQCGRPADFAEANRALCLHLEALKAAAEKVLTASGAAYGARAEVTEMYFPTRTYPGFTLPAGRYRTVRVTLGTGAGHNWWCVIYPALCLPGAEDRDALLETLPEDERALSQHPERYRVRLKVVELFEEFREALRQRFS